MLSGGANGGVKGRVGAEEVMIKTKTKTGQDGTFNGYGYIER